MAYKFQLGKAKLSGSIETAQEITSQGGLTVNGLVDLDAGVISNVELEKSSVMFNGVTVALGATGSFGTDAVTEGSSNLYWTEARGESMFDTRLATKDTDDLAEGSNLYYTDARARAAVSVTDVSGDGSLSYDNSTGVITYTGPSASEVRAHLSAGDGLAFAGGQFAVTSSIAGAGLAWNAGVLSVDTAEIHAGLSSSVENIVDAHLSGEKGISYSGGQIAIDFSEFSTSDVVEGSKLFFTGARAKAAVSAVDAGGDGSFTYDSGSGVFTYTGPSASETRAHFTALTGAAYQNGNLQYNSATGQITLQPVEENWVRQRLSAANAVKYNSASGQISLQLSGTSLAQNADGLKADLKTQVGAYDNSGSIAYNVADGRITFNPVAPSWVKSHFSAGDTDEIDMSYNASTGQFGAVLRDGSIANARLANSSVTVTAGSALTGGGNVALGGTINLDVAVNGDALEIVSDQIALKSQIAGAREFTGNVTIGGDLTVNGTTTYINTTNLVVEDALITVASGSAFAAGMGIELGAEHSLQTVAGDAVVGNALSSSLPLIAPSVKASSFYGNLVGSMQLGVEEKSANATIAKNVTKAMANITLTLPASPVVGQEHRVKCFVADTSSPAIIVAAQAGATIEGESQVVLESYGAAVSLVWDGAMWMVF